MAKKNADPAHPIKQPREGRFSPWSVVSRLDTKALIDLATDYGSDSARATVISRVERGDV